MIYTQHTVDLQIQRQKMPNVGREDRAMLGSNPSARTDGGTSAGDFHYGSLLLPSRRCLAQQSDKPISDPSHSPRPETQVLGTTGLPFGNIYSALVSGVCWIEGLSVSERNAIDHGNEIEVETSR
jgi:hypothetical protein